MLSEELESPTSGSHLVLSTVIVLSQNVPGLVGVAEVVAGSGKHVGIMIDVDEHGNLSTAAALGAANLIYMGQPTLREIKVCIYLLCF